MEYTIPYLIIKISQFQKIVSFSQHLNIYYHTSRDNNDFDNLKNS